MTAVLMREQPASRSAARGGIASFLMGVACSGGARTACWRPYGVMWRTVGGIG
jgi:hypothetical protein